MCTRGKWLLVGHTGRLFHCWTYFWSRSNEETLIQNNCWINAMVFKINGDSSHFLLNSRRSNTICCLVLNLHYNPDELSKATTTGAFKLDVKWDLITFDKTDKSYSKGESIHTSMIYSECTFFLIDTGPSEWWCMESVQCDAHCQVTALASVLTFNVWLSFNFDRWWI